MFMKKARVFVAAAGMLALAVGCSSSVDTTPTRVPGSVIKGAVDGATVWADKVENSETGLGNLVLTEDERSDKTDSSGAFTLVLPAGYPDYVFVSKGGTTIDPVTGDPVDAGLMLAPKGANRVTPITTLVALTPPNDWAAFINSLGLQSGSSYDMDISVKGNSDAEKLLKLAWMMQNTMALILEKLVADPSDANGLVVLKLILAKVNEKGLDYVINNAADIAVEVVDAVNSNTAVAKKPGADVGAIKDEAKKKVEETENALLPHVKISKTTMKIVGSPDKVVASQVVNLQPNEPHNVASFVFETAFTEAGLAAIGNGQSKTWANASVTMEAKNKAVGSTQKIKAVVSGVTVKVDRTGTVPTVTLIYGPDTKLTITGTYASGEAIKKVEIQDADPQANAIVKAEGKNVTVDIVGLKGKIAKVDATLDQKIRDINFNAGDAYELKFSVDAGTEAGLLQAQTVNVNIVNQ